MWNLVTLDGYFEGRDRWDLSWHQNVWGEELEAFSLEQLRSMDTLLFGRVTYEGMASYWASATGEPGEIAELMNGVPKIVFSRTIERADWINTRVVTSNAVAEVAAMKAAPGKDLFVFGSADLCSTLTDHALIDEYRLCVAPVILGAGRRLFREGATPVALKLEEVRRLRAGGVILRYLRSA